jgi:hypothetical protein
MSRFIISLATIVIISLLSVSCYYDNEEALYPTLNTGCDTVNVTFIGTIAPILSDGCYSCHSNTAAAANGNNIRLENYADVQTRITSIIGSVKHAGSFVPMPKNGGQIKACSIAQIDIWVKNGMLFN